MIFFFFFFFSLWNKTGQISEKKKKCWRDFCALESKEKHRKRYEYYIVAHKTDDVIFPNFVPHHAPLTPFSLFTFSIFSNFFFSSPNHIFSRCDVFIHFFFFSFFFFFFFFFVYMIVFRVAFVDDFSHLIIMFMNIAMSMLQLFFPDSLCFWPQKTGAIDPWFAKNR